MSMDSAWVSDIYLGHYWRRWYEGEFVLEEGHRKIEFPDLPNGYLVCYPNGACRTWHLPFIRYGKLTSYELSLVYAP